MENKIFETEIENLVEDGMKIEEIVELVTAIYNNKMAEVQRQKDLKDSKENLIQAFIKYFDLSSNLKAVISEEEEAAALNTAIDVLTADLLKAIESDLSAPQEEN